MIELDALDRQLLRALLEDASQSAGALGRKFSLSQPAMWRRIKRLQDAGVIKGKRLYLNAEALGYGVTVFLGVKLATKGRVSLEDFERAVCAI
ncbi:MAG: Lrp/AsnC family transcriptional regulator, partial [Marinomonas sp.]